MYEAKYNRHIDDYTMTLIDALVGEESNYDPFELSPIVVTDEADCIDDDRLNDLIKYRKNDIGIKVDKEYYSQLQEAVKCPDIRRQFILVDLGYSTAKITTESLYNAIRDEVRNRAFFRSPKRDGLFVRISKQLLLDNDVSLLGVANT